MVVTWGGCFDGGGNSTGLVARGCTRFRSSCSLMAPVCRVARRAASAMGRDGARPSPAPCGYSRATHCSSNWWKWRIFVSP